MSTVRQKRKSCEACRARKLRCSGKHTGCSRCVHLGLVCKFQDKGMPGRPRKWAQIEPREQHRQRQDHQRDGQDVAQGAQMVERSNSYQQDPALQQSCRAPWTVFEESSVATCRPTDLLAVVPQEWTSREADDMAFSYDELGTLPFLDFNTSAQFESLPLDSFQACLSSGVHSREPTELPCDASVTLAAPHQSCDCANQVFEMIRSLKRNLVSHSTVGTLRLGTDLVNKLLTCSICYDVSKPPRLTLQNVLLLGRIFLEVTTGYQKYLKWLDDHCSSLADKDGGDMVYLIPSVQAGSPLGFTINSDKFHDLVANGLQSDAERLADLGRQFALRQHNRHLIGHEACPDAEGRCWKEKDDVNLDLLDICPQSAVARALTPCYRIVDEVRSKIAKFEDAVRS
ncbi:hypothetical protein BKA56DRAFT_589873 [Ilyonectria sp. MPI-CAGE-AT-0026]|nr:hypothetical protein BKA56DRAFT_589873 [Ilyonectria sp. MPI-CAGE-AT-0026]